MITPLQFLSKDLEAVALDFMRNDIRFLFREEIFILPLGKMYPFLFFYRFYKCTKIF